MCEEYFNFVWAVLIIIASVTLTKIIFAYKLTKFKEVAKVQKKKDSEIPDDELEQYVKNPEKTLEALMAQREVFKNDPGKVGAIDAQIKGLELLCKVPAPARPIVMRIMKKTLASAESMIGGMGA